MLYKCFRSCQKSVILYLAQICGTDKAPVLSIKEEKREKVGSRLINTVNLMCQTRQLSHIACHDL